MKFDSTVLCVNINKNKNLKLIKKNYDVINCFIQLNL